MSALDLLVGEAQRHVQVVLERAVNEELVERGLKILGALE
jgi:hypothetical protein